MAVAPSSTGLGQDPAATKTSSKSTAKKPKPPVKSVKDTAKKPKSEAAAPAPPTEAELKAAAQASELAKQKEELEGVLKKAKAARPVATSASNSRTTGAAAMAKKVSGCGGCDEGNRRVALGTSLYVGRSRRSIGPCVSSWSCFRHQLCDWPMQRPRLVTLRLRARLPLVKLPRRARPPRQHKQN